MLLEPKYSLTASVLSYQRYINDKIASHCQNENHFIHGICIPANKLIDIS